MKKLLWTILAILVLLPVCAEATGVDFYSDWTIQTGDYYGYPSCDYIALHDSATVTMTGGNISARFAAYDTSTFKVQGGLVSSSLLFYDSSVANITGGTINGGLNMYNNSVLNISGGTLAGFDLISDSTVANLWGGQIGRIYSHGIVHLYGQNIEIEPYYIDDLYIHGLWGNGTPFEFIAFRAIPYNSQFVIHEIPEPTTLSLLLLGIVAVRKFRG